MNPQPKLVFWQDMPSPHLAPLLRALADIPDTGATELVLMRDLVGDRLAMGWSPPDLGRLKVAMNPDAATASALLDRPGTAHIFSEFIGSPRLRDYLRRACLGPATLGLLSEGRDWRGLKGGLRRIDSFRHERRYARRVDFVLAMGGLGVEWYRRCGFGAGRLFEFGYAVESPDIPEEPIADGDGDGAVRWVFVGQLIRRKRVDLLLRALARLPGRWSLRIVGDGPERETLARMAGAPGLAGKVEFLGALCNPEARRELRRADALILPSHWDGWGAVVNEALLAGIRVVCGDFCGAAALIRDTPCGRVFAGGSVDGLAEALDAELRRGPPGWAERRMIRAYGMGVAGPALAAYLREILAHVGGGGTPVRPAPPWRTYPHRNAHAG